MTTNTDENELLRSVALQNATSILSARQRAERRSEAFLAEAQMLSHTGSFGWRPSTGEIIWSEETFRIFQYDRTTTPTVELILQRVHPEEAAFVRQTIERASQDGKDFDIEHRFRMPDGSVKHLRVVGRPSKDESGILEFVGAVMDVSDRKRTEEKLRRSEADLLEAQRMSQTGSWKLDTSSGTVTVSPQVFRIFGVKPDEDTSTPEFWFSRNHPEDQKRIQDLFERSKIQKTDYDADYRIVLPEGVIKHLHAVGHPVLNESGDLVEFVGTTMDITERKQAEQAARRSERDLRDVVNTVPAHVWSTSPDGQVDFVNDRWLQFTGLALDEAIGWKWETVLHPDDRTRVVADWRTAIKNGQAMESEARVRRADGEYCWWFIRNVPLRDETGKLVRWYGTAIDIEDRKRAEHALRKSEERWRSIFENSAIGVALTDLNGRFLATNHVYQTMVGYTDEELRALYFLDVTHEDYREANWALITELLAGKRRQFQIEKKYLRKDGSSIWISNNVSLVPGTERVPQFIMALSEDITERKRAEALLTGEKRILEMVAKGDSLPQILDSVCRFVEEQASGFLASILLVDGNRLRHGGAPSLPQAYTDAIDGVVIGPSVGSCGTAAYRGEQVIVEDIATDPSWADYRELVLPHSLRAAWSTPVFSSQGKVIATFAMYYREPRSPNPREQETIEQITHLAGVAIERKLTQEALRRSEAYLAEAQRLTHTGSWALNVRTGARFWSQETFRIFDYDPEKVTPTWDFLVERVHPEDRPEIERRAELESTQNKWINSETDFRIVLLDGTIRHLHSIAHPVMDELGEITEVVGTIMDVTERKHAEEALQRSEAYLAEAERLTHIGSWARNMATSQTVYWSQENYRIFGFDPERGIPSREALDQRIHPEDRDRVRREVFHEWIAEGSRFDVEFRIVLPEGRIKYIRSTGQPVRNISGDVLEYVGTSMDVTERKRADAERERLLASERAAFAESVTAQQRFLNLVNSVEGIVWEADVPSFQFLFISKQAERVLGYPVERWLSEPSFWKDHLHPEDQEWALHFCQNATTEKRDHQFEYRMIAADGTVRWLRALVNVVVEGDRITRVRGLMVDLTKHKQAEEALRQAQADLAHVSRVTTMGELTASLAHEVKQPIAAASTDADTCLRWLAADTPNIEEARAAAMRIVKDATCAAEIITRIGSLFKKGAPQRELVDLNAVIQEMIGLLRSEASRYSISIRSRLADDLPKTMADRVQLQQVLMNLMLNAIEAMKDMASVGELTITSLQDDNRQLLISVSDTGVGLQPEQARQIFNAFFTTKPQGTGIGLTISRSIVESHGGRLWAADNSPRGATFLFTLPTDAEAHE